MANDTIFALSSGLPPAGIGVIRISGPRAAAALEAMIGTCPPPRRASHHVFRDLHGAVLDDGLVLWFPGPKTATGEDLAELHCHGGRAVVAAILEVLGAIEGLRGAQAGEFTRRAFENGRIDLAEAEGLSDLLAAETEGQRQAAITLAEGAMGRQIGAWQSKLLRISALVEAALDFADEGDVDEGAGQAWWGELTVLHAAISALLVSPPAERLRDGVRIVLGGPTNSGKSSLFNALIGRQAAIVTDIAGTTRDRIEAPIVLDGLPFLFVDTAGLRGHTDDVVEKMGMDLSTEAFAQADIILWLGDARDAPGGSILLASKADLEGLRAGLPISVVSGEGLAELRALLVERAKALLPKPGALAINARHRGILSTVEGMMSEALAASDLLITAELLRTARGELDRITGKAGVEDMLEALFGTFCIGK